MKRTLPVLLVLTVATLTACGEPAGDGGSSGDGSGDSGAGGPGIGIIELADRVFLAQSVTENGAPRALVEGTGITLTFTADGRLLANAGCNGMQGPYRVTDGKLGLTDLSTTDMGCDPARHEQDGWLADFLTAAPTMELDGHDLTLTAGGRTVALLDREIARPKSALEGPTWLVDTLVSADVASSLPAGASATVVFEAGTVTVDTGCNTGSGTYERTDDTITFGTIALTRKGCADAGLQEVERVMVATLAGAVSYEIDADRLTLEHPSGQGIQLTASP